MALHPVNEIVLAMCNSRALTSYTLYGLMLSREFCRQKTDDAARNGTTKHHIRSLSLADVVVAGGRC